MGRRRGRRPACPALRIMRTNTRITRRVLNTATWLVNSPVATTTTRQPTPLYTRNPRDVSSATLTMRRSIRTSVTLAIVITDDVQSSSQGHLVSEHDDDGSRPKHLLQFELFL